MTYTTLISPENLAEQLDNPEWIIVDCRFDLSNSDAGWNAYRHAHIPGAVYAHLDHDLSGPPRTDWGRHPLPSPSALQALFSQLGVDRGTQVVAYDDRGGAVSSRLWWLLRYMGHEAVAVLDGGWSAWQEAALPTRKGIEQNRRRFFEGQARPERLVLAEEVLEVPRLVDSRTAVRYRGEEEPLDAVAGHIPGAVNYHFGNNLDENNRFLPVEQLRQQLLEMLGETPAEETTFYCGSGVTACHNLLALVHAGLPEGRLYAGSWSDWITEPQRPLVRAEDTEA